MVMEWRSVVVKWHAGGTHDGEMTDAARVQRCEPVLSFVSVSQLQAGLAGVRCDCSCRVVLMWQERLNDIECLAQPGG
jgi:hypothetical protein